MPSITAPLIGGALAGGGGIISGLIGANASKNAAQVQAQAAQNATNTQLGIYNNTVSNLSPFLNTGQAALSQLANLFGFGTGQNGPNANTAAAATSALQNYPGYQFGFGQGLQALGAQGAAQGTYLSGNQLVAAQQYGQNYAMQNAWNPYISNLQQIAGLGENAGAITGNIGLGTGANVANTQLAGGQAAASGIVGASNALTGGVQSGLQNALLSYGLLGGNNANSVIGGPAYGGGNIWSDAYGGSSTSPLQGLTAADYGNGY